ncbi:MAG: hypothetical protein R3F30_03565 [Planctomycetota bacterium]
MRRLPLLLLGLASPCLAQAPDTGPAATDGGALRFVGERNWRFELPDARWTPVGSGLSLAGHEFRAEVEGTRLSLDSDGDGKTDAAFEGKEPAYVLLRAADGFAYAIRVVDRGGWQFQSSGYLQGKLDGTRVRFFDQDNDGLYGEPGADAVAVGSGRFAQAMSPVLRLGDRLVEVRVDGDKATTAAFTGETGVLALEVQTRGKVLALRLRSRSGGLAFDLAKATGEVRLPVGTYTLVGGAIGLGENRVDLTTGRCKDVRVTADGSAELELGGPLRGEFAYVRAGGELKFDPSKVWYYGRAGEEYRAWTPIGASPSFTITEQRSGTELAKTIFPGSC